MGIDSLWPLIKPTLEVVDYYSANAGRTVVVDAFGWLHAFASSDAVQYECKSDFSGVLRKFKARTQQHLDKSVTPIFVFDGQRSIAKAETDAKRDTVRAEARHKARQLFSSGDLVGAASWAKKSVSVSRLIVHQVIHTIIVPMGLSYVVALDESDGQMAYLEATGLFQYVFC